jgi:DNA-binding transcriptional MerR regulator
LAKWFPQMPKTWLLSLVHSRSTVGLESGRSSGFQELESLLASNSHIEDAAAATVVALTHGWSGQAYNVVDDEPVSFADVLRYLAHAVDAPAPWLGPRWLLSWTAPFLTASWMGSSMRVSNHKAKAELGWAPQFPTHRDGLSDTEWYTPMGENKKHNEHDEHDHALDSTARSSCNQAHALPRLLSIDEVAKRTNLTKPTLRFYEQRGLVEPPVREPRTFRKYSQQDLERLEHVKQLRDLLGLSLTEIEETLRVDKKRARLTEQVRAQWRSTTDATLKKDWLDEARRLNQEELEDLNKQLRAVEGRIEGLQRLRAQMLERLERIRDETRLLEESPRGLVETD